MKTSKKIISILLSMLVLIAVCIPVSAENTEVCEHVWGEDVEVVATCYTNAGKTRFCIECGEEDWVYRHDSEIKDTMLPHTMGEWVIIRPKTNYSNGIKVRPCTGGCVSDPGVQESMLIVSNNPFVQSIYEFLVRFFREFKGSYFISF